METLQPEEDPSITGCRRWTKCNFNAHDIYFIWAVEAPPLSWDTNHCASQIKTSNTHILQIPLQQIPVLEVSHSTDSSALSSCTDPHLHMGGGGGVAGHPYYRVHAKQVVVFCKYRRPSSEVSHVSSVSVCAWLLVLSAHRGPEAQGGRTRRGPPPPTKAPSLLPLNPLAKAIELHEVRNQTTQHNRGFSLFPVATRKHEIKGALSPGRFLCHVGFSLFLLLCVFYFCTVPVIRSHDITQL